MVSANDKKAMSYNLTITGPAMPARLIGIVIMAAFASSAIGSDGCGTLKPVVVVSSSVCDSDNAHRGADKATDGNPSTLWGSNWNDAEWILIDLGAEQIVNGVDLLWEAAFGKEYKIQVSKDGRNWSDVYVQKNGKGGHEDIKFISPQQARYVKWQGVKRGTGYGYSLYEFQVFGRSDARVGAPKARQIVPAKITAKNAKLHRGFTVSGLSVQNLVDLKMDWNANMVRLMMTDWDKDSTYKFMDEAKSGLHTGMAAWLDKAAQLNITVVLDLHGVPNRTPTKPQNGAKYNFWKDDTNLQAAIGFWKEMAAFCKDRKQDIYYDILNEPLDWGDFPSYPKVWPDWAQQIINAIRQVDPTHPIVVEVGPGGFCWGFRTFPPLKGNGIIYSVHQYQPHGYTHQGISDIRHTDLAKAYHQTGKGWPGFFSDGDGGMWDKEHIKQELQPAIDFQKKYNVAIYVGEFGVAKWAPQADQYLRDCIEIFEENGWDWTMHAFRENAIWSPEHDNSFSGGGKRPAGAEESARAKVVKEYLRLNGGYSSQTVHPAQRFSGQQ